MPFLRVLAVSIVVLWAYGPSAAASAAARCLAPAAWYALHGSSPLPVAAHDILSDIARRDVVLLGERHDDAEHHRWQLHTLAALHLLRPRMVIGFEAFPRRVQPVLDRWVAGELDERALLEEVDWKKVWSFPAELYLPLFHYARLHRIPMVALNVERALVSAVGSGGWDAVPDERKEGVTRPRPASDAYRAHLFDIYTRHGKSAAPDDPAFRNFMDAQLTWDRAFAQAIAARLAAHAPGRPLVVGIVGSGHVRHGHGIAHQLRDLGVTRIGSLLPVTAPADCSELAPGLADAVFALPGR